MIAVQTAHTADLDAGILAGARALLDDVFEGDMSDHDWEHSLGGMHALVCEGSEVVGHASVVQRRLLHGGRCARAMSRASGCARTGVGAGTARR